jgi:predicted kinase
MRKWMRDKFKRRKKVEDETVAKPVPLQPAYFDSEPEGQERAAAEPAADVHTAKAEESDRGNSESAAKPAGEARESTAKAEAGDPNRRPRRRRRGGRGRRRPGQQPGARVTPAATAVSPKPAPAIARPQGSTKGVVVPAIGLPGSGKSSWFKRHNINPLSSDLLRSLLFDDPTEQGFQDLVFANLRSMLKARLLARRPLNYVDATNLTPHERHSWIKLGKDFGYEVQAVFFDVPLEVCLERNHRRERVVSDEVMRDMSGKLKPPTFDEGFSKITVVRVKQQTPA